MIGTHFASALLALGLALWLPAYAAEATFPRLFGMNIGAKYYDNPDYQRALARLDVVILGFYRGWAPQGSAVDSTAAIRKAVLAIKALNPAILIGQYTVLNETYDGDDWATGDIRRKVEESGWWLTNRSGHRVQWTRQYGTSEINFTKWAPADASGARYPEWLAARSYSVYFRDVPEFDIVYLDNVWEVPRVTADWHHEGRDQPPADPAIAAAYRAGHRAHWDALRRLLPAKKLIGNADNALDDPAFRGQLDGAFLEGLMGESWSIERRLGWHAMMQRYRAALANTRPSAIVAFNVSGNSRDFRFFRYAYASSLLEDGYFSFTDPARGYSNVVWFDEYEFRLGAPKSTPPREAWRHGVWRRDFENGVVLVNPMPTAASVDVEDGLWHLDGVQDRHVNDGRAASHVVLAPHDGVVLRRASAR